MTDSDAQRLREIAKRTQRMESALDECRRILPALVEFGDVKGDPTGQSVVRLWHRIDKLLTAVHYGSN